MAKFLDKKERAIDFKLTPYGKHKLSVGRFKPVYYAFFDNGVVYDSQYAGFSEEQSAAHDRIKNKTQYIEGILSFQELENTVPAGTYIEEDDVESIRLGTTEATKLLESLGLPDPGFKLTLKSPTSDPGDKGPPDAEDVIEIA